MPIIESDKYQCPIPSCKSIIEKVFNWPFKVMEHLESHYTKFRMYDNLKISSFELLLSLVDTNSGRAFGIEGFINKETQKLSLKSNKNMSAEMIMAVWDTLMIMFFDLAVNYDPDLISSTMARFEEKMEKIEDEG